MSKAIALTTTRAPSPHHAPPVSVATRRDLFGAVGALLLLTATEAGPAKAAELDYQLLAACVAFHDANRAMLATWGDTVLSVEQATAVTDTRYDLLAEVIAQPARTPEGLRAKAEVLLLALKTDVPECLNDTLETAGAPHDLLAASLVRDLLGRASA